MFIDSLKHKFPEATLVTLKSGSPRMLVEWTGRDDGMICVVWYDQGMTHRDAFHPDALIIEGASSKDWTESFYVKSKGMVV